MLTNRHLRIPGSLLVLVLFFFSNASAFFSSVIWLTPQIVFSESILWVMLAILSIWILKKHNLLSKFFENLRKNWIILPFLVFSGLSIFWSVDGEISVSRWLILICTIIAGGYIGLRYSIEEIIRYLSIFGICILLLSAVLVVFVPSSGVMNYYIIQGAWKGMYWHKNHMGLIAAFIAILFLINILISWGAKKRQTLLWGLIYLISLLFVYQSGSVAAYLITIFIHGVILVGLIWLRIRKQLRKSHYLILIVILLLAALIVVLNLNHIFAIFDRNSTLTGRVPMWSSLYNIYISKRPFGGYGFNAFWYLPSHQVAMQKVAGYPDPIVISDNGFIDILVNTGFCGLFLFLILYLGIWWRSLKYASKAKDIQGIFPAILMLFTLLANISWSLIFENESFFMLLMISVLFCITADTLPPKENKTIS